MTLLPNKLYAREPDFHHLLRYAYDELDHDESQRITCILVEQPETAIMLKGILAVKATKGFVNSAEHIIWITRKENGIDKVFQRHQLQKKNRAYKFIGYAASFIGLLIYVTNLPLYSSSKLYNKFQSKPEFTVENFSLASSEEQSLISDYYLDNEYIMAIDELNKILETDSTLMTVKFYAGFCSLELGNFDEAINYFSAIIQSDSDQNLKDQALWQMGMTYIKARDFEHAIDTFQTLKKDSRAKKILWRAKVRNFVLENIVPRTSRS